MVAFKEEMKVFQSIQRLMVVPRMPILQISIAHEQSEIFHRAWR